MKKELKTKMIAYLKWRVKHNNLEITYIQIAKYLEIDNRKAEDILKTMVESDFVNQYIQFRCIKCKEVQYIKKENVLYCLNCGQQYSIKDFPIKRQNIYIWQGIGLRKGENQIEVCGDRDRHVLSEKCNWILL